jgi:hypothetical protein
VFPLLSDNKHGGLVFQHFRKTSSPQLQDKMLRSPSHSEDSMWINFMSIYCIVGSMSDTYCKVSYIKTTPKSHISIAIFLSFSILTGNFLYTRSHTVINMYYYKTESQMQHIMKCFSHKINYNRYMHCTGSNLHAIILMKYIYLKRINLPAPYHDYVHDNKFLTPRWLFCKII